MKAFFIKHKFFIAVIFTVFASLSYAFYRQKNTKIEEPMLPPQKQATFNSLVPGVSTKDDVIKSLGEPSDSKNNGNLLEYLSSNPNSPNEVVFESGKVTLIREIITLKEQKSISDLEKEYGNAVNKLYGPHSAAGFDLYVISEKGIAYVGHVESGLLLEIWYFTPMTFEEFNYKYSKQYGYSSTPSKQY